MSSAFRFSSVGRRVVIRPLNVARSELENSARLCLTRLSARLTCSQDPGPPRCPAMRGPHTTMIDAVRTVVDREMGRSLDEFFMDLEVPGSSPESWGPFDPGHRKKF